MLGIIGFCDAKGSRSALEQLKNTIAFKIPQYLAMSLFSGEV